MTRNSKPIQKYNHLGELVEEYESVTDAYGKNKISSLSLYSAIKTGIPLKGYRYQYKNQQPPPQYVMPKNDNQYPWEGPGGVFNIDGWKKVCF